MNMNELFAAGAKPKWTRLLIGTGLFIPSVDNALCRVRLQAGGAGGFPAAGTSGGGAGAMVEFWIRVSITGVAYVVGAPGGIGADGSKTTFGSLAALPGKTATGGGGQGGYGGILSSFSGSVDTDSVSILFSGALDGVSGGCGGYDSGGGMVGHPIPRNSPYATNNSGGAFNDANLRFDNGQGAASGGNSFYGKGGVNGSAPASDAYGAGGGANAAGRGGCIDIEDFGA